MKTPTEEFESPFLDSELFQGEVEASQEARLAVPTDNAKIANLAERLHDTAVPALYTPGSSIEAGVRTTITHLSIVTGRDMKTGKVAPS